MNQNEEITLRQANGAEGTTEGKKLLATEGSRMFAGTITNVKVVIGPFHLFDIVLVTAVRIGRQKGLYPCNLKYHN